MCGRSHAAAVILPTADVALEAEDDDRDAVVRVEVVLGDADPVGLEVGETGGVGDAVAEEDDGGAEEGVGCGAGGVGEFEAVGPVVHADVEGEGLVEVAEDGESGVVGGGVAEG